MTHRPAFLGDDFAGVVAVQDGDRAEAIRLWARSAVDRYLAAERLLQVSTPWGTRLRAELDAPRSLAALLEAHDVIAARFRRDSYQANRDLFASKPTTAEIAATIAEDLEAALARFRAVAGRLS